MTNTVVFNKTDINRTTLCFEDLNIGDIFMSNDPEARYHFIKVEKSISSHDIDFNAICIEDGNYIWFEESENVKKFCGEIALNGIFVEFE